VRFLYDTAVFVYAVGAEHRYREPCRAIVARAQAGQLSGEASVELVQEFAHVRMRRTGDRGEALALAGAVAELCRLHAFEPGDLPLTMTLLAQHEALSVRDAVLAATALNRGLSRILSPDRAFDAIHGLTRVDPADEAAVAALAA
jgi:predicted nucleic acid-binding protein